MKTWREIILHHTAGPDGPRLDVPSIRAYHTAAPPAGRGYSDIGYHFVVERVGESYQAVPGRTLEMRGAHCLNRNGVAIGVALAGDFSEHRPPEGQIQAALDLIEELGLTFGINPSRSTFPHRAFRSTACPGLAWEAIAERLGISNTYR